MKTCLLEEPFGTPSRGAARPPVPLHGFAPLGPGEMIDAFGCVSDPRSALEGTLDLCCNLAVMVDNWGILSESRCNGWHVDAQGRNAPVHGCSADLRRSVGQHLPRHLDGSTPSPIGRETGLPE